jgi:2-haloacid dehalogenase
MAIRAILWDVDGTLLDFLAAEKAAVQRLFGEFGLGTCTDGMVARYSAINDAYWKRLERGEIPKQEVLTGRFREFFTELGLEADLAEAFNAKFQLALGDTVVYRDDSLTIVKALRGKVKQYVVSNGTVVAQTKKLERSHLGEWMDGVFLSEQLGAEKPSMAFFDQVFAALPDLDKEDMLIVGDSLTSEMKGGLAAGIPTCWYNPFHHPRPADMAIDYEIEDLHQVLELL